MFIQSSFEEEESGCWSEVEKRWKDDEFLNLENYSNR